jgi:hypothetical protein
MQSTRNETVFLSGKPLQNGLTTLLVLLRLHYSVRGGNAVITPMVNSGPPMTMVTLIG